MVNVLAFDLDGTLAPSKSALPAEMSECLTKLLTSYQVCVISGGSFNQFEGQLISQLHAGNADLTNLHLMPTCGTQYYRYERGSWRQVYAENFTDDQQGAIMDALNEGVDALELRTMSPYGAIIEDRGSQITFSALGQDIVARLGDEGVRRKQAWDPTNAKKTALRDYVARLIPDFEVSIGGGTSVDITKPGIDKAYGINKLMDILGTSKEELVFFGDRLEKGGNDYPVIRLGIKTIPVNNWRDTLRILKNY